MADSMMDSLLSFAIQYKDRVRLDLIRPAVSWKESGTRDNTMRAGSIKFV